MNKQKKSLEELKKEIESSLTDVTKCYILINYAYNTDEEKALYDEEFNKRFINFYKTIEDIEEDIDSRYMDGINDSLKRILNLEFYKPKINFLESEDIKMEEKDEIVDADYEKKAAQSAVKMNFYHNNRIEFGRNTRFHVNTTKYGVIDPKPHNEEENVYMFSAITNFYLANYSKKLNSKKLKYKKDM